MTNLSRKLVLLALAIPAFASLGCMSSRPGIQSRYQKYTDPCYPQRYNALAQENVQNAFDIQANNAYILDHTIVNEDFEPQSEKLNLRGRQKLDGLAQRRPVEGKMYLQTARDLIYDAKNLRNMEADRVALDVKRAQSVLEYMNSQPAARMVTFEVQPIDAARPSMLAEGPATAVRGLPLQYGSTITGAAGAALTGTGGGLAPGSPAAGQNPQGQGAQQQTGATGGTPQGGNNPQ